MNFTSFYRFVRLLSLCDLAWKSSFLLNKICSIDQIFFTTFQYLVRKNRIWPHFESFSNFSISPSPTFSLTLEQFSRLFIFSLVSLCLLLLQKVKRNWTRAIRWWHLTFLQFVALAESLWAFQQQKNLDKAAKQNF